MYFYTLGHADITPPPSINILPHLNPLKQLPRQSFLLCKKSLKEKAEMCDKKNPEIQ